MEQEDFWKVVQANRVTTNNAIDKALRFRGFYRSPYIVDDLFVGIKNDRIKTDISVIKKLYKNRHKERVLKSIFHKFMNRVIDDIIDNNDNLIIKVGDSMVSFQMERLPMNHIRRFKQLSNYLDGWDAFESEGNAYMIKMRLLHNLTSSIDRYIVPEKSRRDKINKLTNEGKRW